MKNPIVSFVIPVYKKHPEVFRRCLKSLFDQSLKAIEVICVFDGADAELEKVADDFKVRRMVIKHGGAPRARNAGMDIANGEYVVCWDADCFIKPEAARRWVDEFETKPDVDFVYTGYELVGEKGGHDAEFFDPYSLTCGNYISSMSPIRRQKMVKWDETLKGAQDWDYWLTAVEKGLKGSWIPGSGFLVHTGDAGISQEAWSAEKRGETIGLVKQKHGIPDREIAVYAPSYPDRGIKLAKILGADVLKPSGKNIDQYKMLFVFGYGYASRFEGIPTETVKIQYWLPAEIEALSAARYQTVMETIRVSKGVTNLCNTVYEKNRLSELGISADVVPLPLSDEDMEKVSTDLPEKFKVLLVADEAYGKLLQELPVDLPTIDFVYNQANVKDCSLVLSFYRFSALDDALLVAHVNGRNIISNVQAPYCGYIDPDVDYEDFKSELYSKIRLAKDLPFNSEAQTYYRDLASSRKFKESILSRFPQKLEVV